ncbi:MAG: DUF4349 domain-containing protein [Candidatus Methanomethylicia archaeon]|jgi:predicted  nucleic acid-binding Zn-ribbon protein|nr:DUF4349 domain-containing protein [Candidatus Methanomethylicia archaeon]NHV59796.1 hypothetical protein [Candidatus Verstraetearchaeota archaeon]
MSVTRRTYFTSVESDKDLAMRKRLRDLMSNMETNTEEIENIISSFETRLENISKRLDSLEDRVSRLEKKSSLL